MTGDAPAAREESAATGGRLELPSGMLRGRHVQLEPLSRQLRDELREALASDDDAWSIMVANGGTSGFPGWWQNTMVHMAHGDRLVYAVRRLTDAKVVGSTGYFGIVHDHLRLEIGSTFLQPDARSGVVNPECKLLLLEAAFAGNAIRVEFVTDALNPRSRAALRKLGAREEALLRRHKITWTGRVRDTVLFSIVDEDWPSVRAALCQRVAGFSPAHGMPL